MAKVIITDTNLKNIGGAIRTATNTTSTIKLTDMPTKIKALSSQDATAGAGDMLKGKTAYVKGSKVTGTIATKTSTDVTASGKTVSVPAGYYASAVSKSVGDGSATTPTTTIEVNPSIYIDEDGWIDAENDEQATITPTIVAGYVTNGTAGTITVSGSSGLQLPTHTGGTYTPKSSSQTISTRGKFMTGDVVIQGSSNLVASNIKKGVSIFGVTGTYAEQPYETTFDMEDSRDFDFYKTGTSYPWNTFLELTGYSYEADGYTISGKIYVNNQSTYTSFSAYSFANSRILIFDNIIVVFNDYNEVIYTKTFSYAITRLNLMYVCDTASDIVELEIRGF